MSLLYFSIHMFYVRYNHSCWLWKWELSRDATVSNGRQNPVFIPSNSKVQPKLIWGFSCCSFCFYRCSSPAETPRPSHLGLLWHNTRNTSHCLSLMSASAQLQYTLTQNEGRGFHPPSLYSAAALQRAVFSASVTKMNDCSDFHHTYVCVLYLYY